MKIRPKVIPIRLSAVELDYLAVLSATSPEDYIRTVLGLPLISELVTDTSLEAHTRSLCDEAGLDVTKYLDESVITPAMLHEWQKNREMNETMRLIGQNVPDLPTDYASMMATRRRR